MNKTFSRFRIAFLCAATWTGLSVGSMADATENRAPEDWPSFRGNPALTGVAKETLTPPLAVRWTVETGSAIEATAAIVDDTVYAATAEGRIMALDLKDGRRRWQTEAGAALSASPAVDGGRLYIGNANGLFMALKTEDGTRLWSFETEGKIESSATVSHGLVLFGSYDHHLYALDAVTGTLKWKHESEAPMHGTPGVVDGLVLAAGCDGMIVMLDVATGKRVRTAEAGVHFSAGPAGSQGHAWIGSVDGDYRAVRLADAETVWHVDTDERLGACHANAAVAERQIVFASRNRRVFSLDRTTGKTQWTFAIRDKTDSSPVVSGPTVYVGASDGVVYGLNLDDGKEVWRFTTGAPVTASPAIGRGVLVIGARDGALYCFEPANR